MSRLTPARTAARPSFQQIEIFLKVVEARSFVGAARLLGVSQPAVSLAIARLEDIFSGDLFVRRRGAALSLTPIGEAILPYARSLLHTVDQQLARAAVTARGQSGRLRIGLNCGLAAGPLRAGLADFVRDAPDVALQLVEAAPGELHRRLNDRELDLIFAAFMPELAAPHLVQESIWIDTLVAVLPESQALAGRASLTWRDLSKSVLVDANLGGTAAGGALAARSGAPRDQSHGVSRATLDQMVALGLGIGVSLASAITAAPGLVIVPIEGAGATVPIHGVWHHGDANPARHRFVRMVRERAVESSGRG